MAFLPREGEILFYAGMDGAPRLEILSDWRSSLGKAKPIYKLKGNQA